MRRVTRLFATLSLAVVAAGTLTACKGDNPVAVTTSVVSEDLVIPVTAQTIGLLGGETFTFEGMAGEFTPGATGPATIAFSEDGTSATVTVNGVSTTGPVAFGSCIIAGVRFQICKVSAKLVGRLADDRDINAPFEFELASSGRLYGKLPVRRNVSVKISSNGSVRITDTRSGVTLYRGTIRVTPASGVSGTN